MDRNPTSPDRSPTDISYLREIFQRGLECAIIIPMHNKEWGDKTSTSQHKAEFATQKQPRREVFKDVNKKLGPAPEKISGAELSWEESKLAPSAIEDTSRSPLSAEKSLRDPATSLVYQSRPMRQPDLEKEHKPAAFSFAAEWDESYPPSSEELELDQALERVDTHTFEQILESIAPGNPWAEEFLASKKK